MPPKGVCKHRHTGAWEAQIWMPTRPPGKNGTRCGYQLYLGSFSDQDLASRARDLGVLKFCPGAATNFPEEDYEHLRAQMADHDKDSWLTWLRTTFDRRHLAKPAPNYDVLWDPPSWMRRGECVLIHHHTSP